MFFGSRAEAAAAATLAILSVGCARNAILEVDVELPAGPTDRYAVVQFENGDAEYLEGWESDSDYPGTPLLADEPQTVSYSVVTESSDPHLRMRVAFCITPDCTDVDDSPIRVPGVWYDLPVAFYIGHRTRWTATIDAVPPAPPTEAVVIDRCAIEGCIEAPDGEVYFCRLDGRHYCE